MTISYDDFSKVDIRSGTITKAEPFAVNLGEKNIAGFASQFLMLGCSDAQGAVCLATLDPKVENGERLF